MAACPFCDDDGDVERLAGGDDMVCWDCDRVLKRDGKFVRYDQTDA